MSLPTQKLLKASLLLSTSVVLASNHVDLNHISTHVSAKKSTSMKYIDDVQTENKNTSHDNLGNIETRSQEEVSMDEGIAAEQIVVKITDSGYVTSHGDHNHFYSGDVPFDLIF